RGLAEGRFDVLVTSLGVNDVTGGRTVRGWLDDQRALRGLARSRLGVSLLVITGVPPMGRFPALPQPLRWYLGSRADRFDERLRADL
ncbi:MAG: SGNH/GDSL hydrolase family protein, partial [Gemmatimonadetes bacterium]|nr:SGNH/GDSL hydrolase family protein [Gemmatimonadota bacterium]NIQ57962.1 SGNH/GDSL hydrolase family protein [Gemmatimonadota bacterium]NIU78143.1 SGNH/GDSL hydrolase family protein [Gammaproteobacteria bacterium]NIX47148.1 SGNH/GDSL hydrolase family protein [Gemmatimonadota bacterium]NIY11521.1 SGNH/GDSL hydrolase family protein [Gemmatimonadota bacterium]